MLKGLSIVSNIFSAAGKSLKIGKDSAGKHYLVSEYSESAGGVLLSDAEIAFMNSGAGSECCLHVYECYKTGSSIITISEMKGKFLREYVVNSCNEYYVSGGSSEINYGFYEKVADQLCAMEKLFVDNGFSFCLEDVHKLVWDGSRLYYGVVLRVMQVYTGAAVQVLGVNWLMMQQRAGYKYTKWEVLAAVLKKSKWWSKIEECMSGASVLLSNGNEVQYYICASRLLCVLDEAEYEAMWKSQSLWPVSGGIYVHCPKLLSDDYMSRHMKVAAVSI
jgi:hypothetical protein